MHLKNASIPMELCQECAKKWRDRRSELVPMYELMQKQHGQAAEEVPKHRVCSLERRKPYFLFFRVQNAFFTVCAEQGQKFLVYSVSASQTLATAGCTCIKTAEALVRSFSLDTLRHC
jgi:hypothetical protein